LRCRGPRTMKTVTVLYIVTIAVGLVVYTLVGIVDA
jgi:hypothetical protein